ncbi:MAG: iron-containing alcohol dehydrogenase [Paracoccus sp. (in: a-proteobacteria)]|uniref:iron-containing alcohol dehydrogenase n=1 Tax=Paracoccus sp. TaxID=267 RepID=UPI0026E08E48|nr:iron-containing alcohol dehydrogenase [Paracoccus sp. (in: a-proteobacteria)]MDO5614011.1 iron-containing alcohol dehydrogenase [Paracoccus sp. (in: a-proteobacteria)]
MTPFSFMTATEIAFGRGSSLTAADRIRAMAGGGRVLLVHGADGRRADWLAAVLDAPLRLAVPGEPDLPLIRSATETARAAGVVAVVALGGGSAIDAGKAIAALIPATRPITDHLEVVGAGLPLDRPPLPFVAIPTTAGTGAEVTRNAVITVPDHRRKVSLRDPAMLPRLAIVDPALTDGCPRGVTLASGLDAVTQVIEPFCCTRANPLTDALCRDAIPRGLAALIRLMQVQDDTRARDELAWVSLCGGLALANSGLGAVHGLAGPLGGLTGAAHGAICGALLAPVLTANRAGVTDPALAARLDQVGAWIAAAFGLPAEIGLTQAAAHLAQWARAQGLPPLRLDQATRRAAADAAAASSSMRANPAALDADALERIMAAAG